MLVSHAAGRCAFDLGERDRTVEVTIGLGATRCGLCRNPPFTAVVVALVLAGIAWPVRACS
jgi:hypothetical protein